MKQRRILSYFQTNEDDEIKTIKNTIENEEEAIVLFNEKILLVKESFKNKDEITSYYSVLNLETKEAMHISVSPKTIRVEPKVDPALMGDKGKVDMATKCNVSDISLCIHEKVRLIIVKGENTDRFFVSIHMEG